MFRATTSAGRVRAWLFSSVCLCLTGWAGLAAGQTTAAPTSPPKAGSGQPQPESEAPAPVTPSFLLTPILRVQETWTDNALLTPSGSRRSDFITRLGGGLIAEVNRGRLGGTLSADVAYDRYARVGHLSGWTYAAQGSGAYWLVHDRLSIEADGSLSNGYTNGFSASAVDRSGTNGRTQLGIFSIGPRLTLPVGTFADLNAAARYGRVSYSAADNSQTGPLPEDDNLFQSVARLDTGDRISRYQLVTAAEFNKDDRGYRYWSGVQSVFVRLTPKVRLIARGGYEDTHQRGIDDISAPLLSAGLEYRPNAASRITVEGGQRYKRSAWAATADVKLTERSAIYGNYTESLTPDQVYVGNAFTEFLSMSAQLRPLVTTRKFSFDENLYNQASFNKRAEVRLTHSAPSELVELRVLWSDRRFIATDTHDRFILGGVAFTRHVRPDFDLGVAGEYAQTYASPLYGKSKNWLFTGRGTYLLNSTTSFNAEYHYKHGTQDSPGGGKLNENVVLVSLQKRF